MTLRFEATASSVKYPPYNVGQNWEATSLEEVVSLIPRLIGSIRAADPEVDLLDIRWRLYDDNDEFAVIAALR